MASSQLQSPLLTLRLTPEQKAYIGSILPLYYSLQPAIAAPNSVIKAPPGRRAINSYSREEPPAEKQPPQTKRKKNKLAELTQAPESKLVPSKRDEINRRANIIKKLRKHEASWPFRTAVDPKALSIPNYNQIVLVPMDLQTIQQNLKNQRYEHPGQIERDINQMFLNSYKFNSKNGEYFEATMKLEQFYQSILTQGEQNGRKEPLEKLKKKQQSSSANGQGQKTSQVSEFQRDLANLLKKANQLTNYKPVRQKPVYVSLKQDGSITIKEKRELVQEIKQLQQFHLSRIYEIVRQSRKDSPGECEVVSLDLEKMDNRLVRELQNYVRLQRNSVVHDREESLADSLEHQYSIC